MTIIRYLPFAGRLMIGLPFAMSGLSKLGAYSATTGMIGAAGLPFPPLAFAVAVVIELGGGLLLIAGYRVRYAAAALALFSLAAAVSFHNNFADQNQMIHFLKNVRRAFADRDIWCRCTQPRQPAQGRRHGFKCRSNRLTIRHDSHSGFRS